MRLARAWWQLHVNSGSSQLCDIGAAGGFPSTEMSLAFSSMTAQAMVIKHGSLGHVQPCLEWLVLFLLGLFNRAKESRVQPRLSGSSCRPSAP